MNGIEKFICKENFNDRLDKLQKMKKGSIFYFAGLGVILLSPFLTSLVSSQGDDPYNNTKSYYNWILTTIMTMIGFGL